MAEVVSAQRRDKGYTIMDVRTPVHFGVGMAGGAAGVDPSLVMIAVLTYEAAAEAYRAADAHGALFTVEGAQTRANTITDIAMTMVGAFVGRYLRQQYLARQTARTVAQLQTPPPVAGLGQPGMAPLPWRWPR